jgi:hypothetical protein
MSFLVFLVLLGVPSVFASRPTALRTRLPAWQQLLVSWPFGLAVAITAQVIRQANSRTVAGDGAAIFYRIDLRFVGSWTAWIVAGALVVSLGCILAGHRMLGAAVSYVSLPWLTMWVGSHGARFSAVRLFSGSWHTATVLGLMALVLMVQVAVPGRRSSSPDGG